MEPEINKQIIDYIKASYPLIYIVSFEEQRVTDSLIKIAGDINRKILFWTVTKGFTEVGTSNSFEGTDDPLLALDFIYNNLNKDKYMFILKDFHSFMDNVVVVRKMRDCIGEITKTYSCILIVTPVLNVPPDLEKEVTVIDYPLPGRDELSVLIDNMAEIYKDKAVIKLDVNFRERLVDALLGLTLTETENVLARSLVSDARLDEADIQEIVQEKRQIIRKSGVLEFYPLQEGMDSVGGLETLKQWLKRKRASFQVSARAYGLQMPKGVLLTGVPGCGKSLTAKAVASEWSMPLLRFDLGKVFGMYVGQSEENIRRAVSTAESIAPCVLWIDELEKGFAGVGSRDTDSGVTARVFGTFITWMQEKQSPVFVVATANDVSQLPPELLRKGRFDEIFFIDLPNASEREEIIKVQIKRFKRDPAAFDVTALSKLSEGFTGSDLEGVITAALEESFLDGEREPTTDDIADQIGKTLPLSTTMKERIEALRSWAKSRAMPASSKWEEVPVVSFENYTRGRKIEFQ
jgi:ATP-dependent 26S proteasome regulatory subunit